MEDKIGHLGYEGTPEVSLVKCFELLTCECDVAACSKRAIASVCRGDHPCGFSVRGLRAPTIHCVVESPPCN